MESASEDLVRRRVLKIPLKPKSPFKWDGSFLGAYKSIDILLECSDTGRQEYIVIEIDGYKETCIRYTGNIISCIYDEIKEVFGLIKTGTHLIKIDNKSFVLYKAICNDGLATIDTELDSKIFKQYKEVGVRLKDDVRKYLTYRQLLGVSPNIDTDLKIRFTLSGFPYLVSFNDKFTIRKDGTVATGLNGYRQLSSTGYNKWFKDLSFSNVLKDMLKYNPNFHKSTFGKALDNRQYIIQDIRDKITRIVTRLDGEKLWLIKHIVDIVSNNLE